MINILSNRLRSMFSTEGFRGPVLTLLTGSTTALTLSFFAQPVITRLYTEAELGILGYFVAVMVVLMSFASLRYEDALMLKEKDEDSGALFWLAVFVLGCTTMLTGLLVIWSEPLAALAGVPEIAPYLILVPPTLLAMRLFKIADLWLVRMKEYRCVSAAQVANTGTMVGTRVGVGLPPVNAGAEGLIGGFLAGHIVSALIAGYVVARRYGRLLVSSFSVRAIARGAVRYRRFPLFSTPSATLAALIAKMPILLIPLYFPDKALLGLVFLAFQVISIPLGHIGGAVAKVFFPHAAKAQLENRLQGVTAMVHGRMVMIGVVPIIALLLVGPDVFEVVFGANWRQAGAYARYIAPWLLLASIVVPLTRVFDVTERQRLDFVTSAVMFVCVATALIVGGRTGEITTMLFLLGCAGAGVRGVQLIVLLRLAHVPIGKALGAYARYCVMGLPGLVLILAALTLDSSWITTGATAIALLIYAGIVVWKDNLRLA